MDIDLKDVLDLSKCRFAIWYELQIKKNTNTLLIIVFQDEKTAKAVQRFAEGVDDNPHNLFFETRSFPVITDGKIGLEIHQEQITPCVEEYTETLSRFETFMKTLTKK